MFEKVDGLSNSVFKLFLSTRQYTSFITQQIEPNSTQYADWPAYWWSGSPSLRLVMYNHTLFNMMFTQ